MADKIKPFSELSNDEWTSCLEILKGELGADWLQKKSNNPVQILWQREDIPASQELYILSEAIKNLRNIDENCLKQQIKKIKSKDKNTCKGHCFEVIALSYFQTNYKMLPTPRGKAGVDATIEFDNIEMNWSFKNHGISIHQINFENGVKQIEDIVKSAFFKRKISNFDITLFFLSYPETSDIWDSIEKQMIDDISKYNGDRIINGDESKNYCYRIQNLTFENLANTNMSYTFSAICPHHRNEERNFCSKLDDAVANLLEHSSLKDNTKILKNALLIHIPNSIDISNCKAWGQNYLNDSNKHINLIAFYQTYIAQDKEGSSIQHAWQYLTKDLELKQPFKIEIPVGKVTNETIPLIISATGDKLENKYVYQNGEIYNNARRSPNGVLTGNLSSIAIGITSNTVFKLPNDNRSFVISPKIFSPDNKLLIL